MLARRDLFQPLGDEMIYALAGLGGLFGDAALKLGGDPEKGFSGSTPRYSHHSR